MCRRDDLILRQVYKSFILLLAYQLLLARTFLHSISYCKIKKKLCRPPTDILGKQKFPLHK